MKKAAVILGFLFVSLSAKADFNGPGPSSGVRGVLTQLSQVFGSFFVNGKMADGSDCKVSVDAWEGEFAATIEDKYSGARGLMTVRLLPKQRLAFFDIRTNPEVRVELRLRDRIVYPGAPTQDVDASLYIQEDPKRPITSFVFEDHVRRKRYTCSGYKSATFRSSGTIRGDYKFYSPWGQQ